MEGCILLNGIGKNSAIILVQDLDWTAIACFGALINQHYLVWQMRQASWAFL